MVDNNHMGIIYDLIFAVFSIVYFPYLILKRKWHRDFSMRFGNFSPALKEALAKKENIWIHAVSVGEVLAVPKLAQHVKSLFPSCRLVISTVTQTGYAVASKIISGNDKIIYAPLDFSFAVKKYVAFIKPKIYIAMETEIWPNLFTQLYKNHTPVALINGRISDRAFGNYRLVRFLMARILRCVDVFCMQTQTDCERIIALGAPGGKVHQVGNVKFDDLPTSVPISLQDFGFTGNETLWIAGSTHPGEEEVVLRIFRRLAAEFKDMRLMIAPRHIERTDEIVKLAEDNGFAATRFSDIRKEQRDQSSIVVVDTMGQLRSLYSLAHLVFIGKSLTVHGGQNIIEPAAFGKPVFVGPYTENFKDVVDVFVRENAAIRVKDADDLLLKMKELLMDPRRRDDIGLRAKGVIQRNSGATKRTVEILTRLVRGN